MKRTRKFLAVLLALVIAVIPMTFFSVQAKTVPSIELTLQTTLINLETSWQYLDDGTDPAGDGERTSWTKTAFDDTAWKTSSGTAKFGGRHGFNPLEDGTVPTVQLQRYLSGTSANVPAYFFRTSFILDSAPGADWKVEGSLRYDDAAIIYINGQKVASFHEPEGGFASNLFYGGSNWTYPLDGTFTADGSVFKEGLNTVAVEIHQSTSSSSDIYFEFTSLTVGERNDVLKTVSLGVGKNETERNLTWHIDSDKAGKVQYAKKNSKEFPAEYVEVDATSTLAQNDSGFYINKVTLTGLEPNTEYVYRLVNGLTVSQVYEFKTQGTSGVNFLFVGDPQIGSRGTTNDAINWRNTVDIATTNFPNSNMLISAGDQVENNNNEPQYLAYLSPAAMPSLTNATVIGNHDTGSVAYTEHFNNPNIVSNENKVYGATTAGCNYWYTYNNVLFLHLNTNNLSTAEHKEFLEKAIAQNPDVSWKVVVFHHSLYSGGGHYLGTDSADRRNALVPVFDELDIDVVLMGHDHMYVRTYIMNGLVPDKSNGVQSSVTDPTGVLYVTANSSTGSKYYDINTYIALEHAAVKSQEYSPSFANVEITQNSFKITTYRLDLSVLDSFEILRASEPHDYELTYVPATPSSCSVQGNIEHWRCDDCGKFFSDAEGRYEIETIDAPFAAHTYDNKCDNDCNICGYVREPSAHIYNNDCDAECNECGGIREVPDHVYDDYLDDICNVCDEKRLIIGTTGDCTWTLDGTVLTISGNGAMADYDSASPAPWGNIARTVIIADGVTSIGKRAFYNCTYVDTLTIGKDVETVGTYAFYGCTYLKTVNIYSKAVTIGYSAFNRCSKLATVCYFGTEAEKEQMKINSYNDPLKNAEWQYSFTLGDADGDGAVSENDVIYITAILLKNKEYTEALDMNSDGKIDVIDGIMLRKKIGK